jgi:hypothetical protein
MWGSRLSPRPATTESRVVALLPRSSTPGASPAAGELVIEVGSVRVRVGPGFDRALLAEVIGVLGAAR